jgi:hypothetical protein
LVSDDEIRAPAIDYELKGLLRVLEGFDVVEAIQGTNQSIEVGLLIIHNNHLKALTIRRD